ncbi:MAG: sigma-54-dependent Fis family transcriptional regulator [Parcubacteria group bacterium]|nr:sigma-54-dependent Fis family transcriptional regulator [Parcubacteria group bacterium]
MNRIGMQGIGLRTETQVRWSRFIGESAGIQKMKRTLEQLAPTEETIVLQGETGVGKEVAAHEIHAMSNRANEPFIIVDCASLAMELMENELFGHDRGAFTSAHHPAIGLIEAANGGTLFIDQVEDMPPHLQARFLRATENHEVRRIGETKYRPVDVRLIVATGANLYAMVKNGKFRSDLFYRLYEFPVPIVPLRERDGDLGLLTRHFLQISESEEEEIEEGVLALLCQHRWPGNVRELKNVIKHSKLFSNKDIGVLTVEAVRTALGKMDTEVAVGESAQINQVNSAVSHPERGRSLSEAMASLEAEMISAALKNSGGDKKLTAISLGIALKTLYSKLHRYGLGSTRGCWRNDTKISKGKV